MVGNEIQVLSSLATILNYISVIFVIIGLILMFKIRKTFKELNDNKKVAQPISPKFSTERDRPQHMEVLTDIELITRCATKMGYEFFAVCEDGVTIQTKTNGKYNPLIDDLQMSALIKKFKLRVCWNDVATEPRWDVFPSEISEMIVNRVSNNIRNISKGGHDEDLNRAVCECVAKL